MLRARVKEKAEVTIARFKSGLNLEPRIMSNFFLLITLKNWIT